VVHGPQLLKRQPVTGNANES